MYQLLNGWQLIWSVMSMNSGNSMKSLPKVFWFIIKLKIYIQKRLAIRVLRMLYEDREQRTAGGFLKERNDRLFKMISFFIKRYDIDLLIKIISLRPAWRVSFLLRKLRREYPACRRQLRDNRLPFLPKELNYFKIIPEKPSMVSLRATSLPARPVKI